LTYNNLTTSSPSIIESIKPDKDFNKLSTKIKHPKSALVIFLIGHKQFEKLRKNDSCEFVDSPKTELEKLMTQPSTIRDHLNTLYMLTIEFNLKNTLELGTQFGNSTTALLYAAKEINGKVTTIDVDPCKFARKKIKSLELDPFCNFIQSDDTEIEWSEPIDHLFIDSNHSYNHVTKQLNKYEPYVRKGGLITLHDIVMHEFDSEGNPIGKISGKNSVLRAVENFIEGRNDLKLYKYFNCNGLGIIRKY